MQSYRFVSQVILVFCFLFLSLAACRSKPETAVPSPSPVAAAATVSLPTATEPATTLPSPTSPAATPAPTSAPTVETLFLAPEPVFVGGDVRWPGWSPFQAHRVYCQDPSMFLCEDARWVGWSPDGRYLAYFEYTVEQLAQSDGSLGTAPGTFTIYDTATGEKCQRYPLDARFSYEGPGLRPDRRHAWLPHGDFFVITETGAVFQAGAPCGHDQDITSLFPEPVANIVNSSPDGQWLLFSGNTAYWLYNLETRAVHPIAEVTPDRYNNLVWSPDSRHIGVTLAGSYPGDPDPVGGSRVVEVASGLIRARYDWEATTALGSTHGGPVWLNNTEMLITASLDQGPFFLTVAGAVRPVLPLFGLEFVRGRYTPLAHLYVEPETGHYHILLTDLGYLAERLSPQLYHSDTNTVEQLPNIQYGSFLTTDGRLVVFGDDDHAWGRAVTAAGEPLAEVSNANCISLWNPPDTLPYAARTMPHNVIALYGPPDCTLLAQLQLAGYDDDATSLALLLAPGGRWLAAIPYNNSGFGPVLFVLDLENPDSYAEAATEPATEPVAEPTTVPVPTAIPTRTAAAAITGEAIAYVQNDTLFIRALDGGEAIAVETCPEGSYCQLQYLKWSPDGQHLLYYYNTYTGGNYSLRLADRQGNVQIVSDDVADSRPGAWSPDGRTIAFFRATNTTTEGSETERPADVHEVWTAAVPSEDLAAGSADGAVGELQRVGPTNLYYGCGGAGRSASEVLYENEGGTPYGYLMGVTEWTASGILLYTLDCGNVGIGRFDMNSGMELEPFDIALRSLVLNNTRDRWYAVTGPTYPPETTDYHLATGTPDSPAVAIIPTSRPVELVFYGPVSGRLYYTVRELVERAGAPGPDYWLDFAFYRSELRTINPDGTGETLLWQAEDHAFASLAERPDGRILFTRVENERRLYQAAQDATITDLSPYAPQRHIVQIAATGGEPVVAPIVVIENAGQPSTIKVPTSNPCMNDSVFVLDVNVPDGTHFAPAAPFTKTWRLRNSGTCTWDASYRLNFVSGEPMDGPESTALGQTVLPGEEVDISIELVAPQADGTYRGLWQLVAPDGMPFGANPYVEIVVP